MNIKVLFVLLVSFCVFSPVFAVQARKPKVPFDRSGPAVNKEGMDSLLLHKTKDGENFDDYLKRTGDAFMEEVKQRENIIAFKSGLLLEIVEYNRDENAKSPAGDHSEIVFTFVGTLKNGVKFNAATSETYLPYMKTKAWKEAIQYMVEGDRFKFYVPHTLGYGLQGSPPKIPKASPIVFDIELLSVTSGKKSAAKARKMLEDNTIVIEKKLVGGDEDAEL